MKGVGACRLIRLCAMDHSVLLLFKPIGGPALPIYTPHLTVEWAGHFIQQGDQRYYHILPEHHILQKEPPCNFLQIQQMSPLWLIRQLNLCLQLHMPAPLLIPNQWTTLHRSLWRLVTADEATSVYSPTKNLI